MNHIAGEILNTRKIDPRSYFCNLKKKKKKMPEKNAGLNGNRTHDLCDAGAVLYRELIISVVSS